MGLERSRSFLAFAQSLILLLCSTDLKHCSHMFWGICSAHSHNGKSYFMAWIYLLPVFNWTKDKSLNLAAPVRFSFLLFQVLN